MDKMPKKRDSAQTILTRHKDKVFEMWSACYSLKDIHRFLLESGEDIGYHRVRIACIKFFNFNTKIKGSFLGETESSEKKESNRTPEPKKDGFTYNPKAPDARTFWED
ncbi:hypothetical protein OZX61_12850 (plasmid) [Acinetobacter sp. ESL0695]|uniref:hypothetical protein n=1 Tax=Acinetobacter sp. ESL0695 TaxID=2983215 RepID=UPI0023EFAEA6|nr:hypothetical protein [Acinetobacter sp. ESL0695]WEV50230.1 hypothetical protein OZX61_12850 [Acinetobacter sp. ESL0695]